MQNTRTVTELMLPSTNAISQHCANVAYFSPGEAEAHATDQANVPFCLWVTITILTLLEPLGIGGPI